MRLVTHEISVCHLRDHARSILHRTAIFNHGEHNIVRYFLSCSDEEEDDEEEK
jgi:hypothetical protein